MAEGQRWNSNFFVFRCFIQGGDASESLTLLKNTSLVRMLRLQNQRSTSNSLFLGGHHDLQITLISMRTTKIQQSREVKRKRMP